VPRIALFYLTSMQAHTSVVSVSASGQEKAGGHSSEARRPLAVATAYVVPGPTSRLGVARTRPVEDAKRRQAVVAEGGAKATAGLYTPGSVGVHGRP
jgi:hypothetical protein